MKILLFLSIFFVLIGNTHSKEKFTEKCDGFCVGEKLKIEAAQYPEPTQIFVNGKKKKAPMWTITRAVRKPKSVCIVFDSYLNRVIPKEFKKNETEKNMKDFREGTEIFSVTYNINACRPCPAGMKPSKRDKTGYCNIEMFSLAVLYKNGFDKGYLPPDMADFSQLGVGRDVSFDIATNLPNANNQVVYEYLTFPVSLKKDLIVIRFKDKESNNLYYVYSYHTYKTTAKNQVRKQTQMDYVKDQNLIEFLDEYLEKIQKTFSSVWDKRHKNFENISKLYELIPNENELKVIENSFEEVVAFHIQNRQ